MTDTSAENSHVTGKYASVHAGFVPKHREYYENPARYYVDPFRIAGNLYYIGDRQVCSHLIDTGEGLIMFDSGFPHSAHLLVQAIWQLGFDPKDIRYLIHSHGHFDHFGAWLEFRTLYGCQIVMSRVDHERISANPALALMEYSPTPYARIIEPDILLDDGSRIELGNTSIECKLAPGHTEGTMAFFFDIKDEGRSYRVGYFGGIGFLSLYRDYLKKYGIERDMQQAMSQTVRNLRREHVDITIGNHPDHNDTLGKRAQMIENPDENPFIDSETWPRMLDGIDRRLAECQEQGW